MNTMRLLAIVAGAVFFGSAMAVREYADTVWSRAVIASVGVLGMGVAIVIAQRKQETKEE